MLELLFLLCWKLEYYVNVYVFIYKKNDLSVYVWE